MRGSSLPTSPALLSQLENDQDPPLRPLFDYYAILRALTILVTLLHSKEGLAENREQDLQLANSFLAGFASLQTAAEVKPDEVTQRSQFVIYAVITSLSKHPERACIFFCTHTRCTNSLHFTGCWDSAKEVP